MRRSIIGLILLALVPAGLKAQSDSLWSLQECIRQAIDYNVGMKRQELMLQSASEDVRQSKMDLLPNLNGNFEHQLGSGRVLDRGTYTWSNANVSQGDMGLQSDLTLFDGLQGYNSMKMQKAAYQMSMEDLKALEDDLTIQVMTSYLSLLRNMEIVEVARLNVEVTQQQVERMERLVDVGNESKGKLLEVRSQHSAARLTLTQARNAMEISRLDLMHLLNLTSLSTFGIEEPLLPDPSAESIPSVDSVFQYALEHLPQIRSAEFAIEAQERRLAVSRGDRSPRIYARGLLYTNYSDGLLNPRDPDPGNPTMDYPLGTQLTDNRYNQVAMGISIPIFNRWQVQTTINKAKISLQDAEFAYDDAVLALQKGVQQYHAEAVAALDSYVSAQESVANSEQVYRFAEEKFQVGTGTALEMQEARKTLFESTSDMISSRYVLIFYSKILDFYMGKEITF